MCNKNTKYSKMITNKDINNATTIITINHQIHEFFVTPTLGQVWDKMYCGEPWFIDSHTNDSARDGPNSALALALAPAPNQPNSPLTSPLMQITWRGGGHCDSYLPKGLLYSAYGKIVCKEGPSAIWFWPLRWTTEEVFSSWCLLQPSWREYSQVYLCACWYNGMIRKL